VLLSPSLHVNSDKGEISRCDTLQASGLTESGRTEAQEGATSFVAQARDGVVVDGVGQAAAFHFVMAADVGLFAANIGLIAQIGVHGDPGGAGECMDQWSRLGP